MLNCREVTRLVASDEFADSSWWPRLRLRLHLLMCRHCSRYARQIERIGASARDRWSAEPRDPGELERLESAILQKLTETREPPDDPAGPEAP